MLSAAGGMPRWRRDAASVSEDLNALARSNLECGSNMESALSGALKQVPGATDICIFCHSHAFPFEMSPKSPSAIDWKTFARRHYAAKIHFVAVGKGSDRETLSAMAAVTNGAYYIYIPTSK